MSFNTTLTIPDGICHSMVTHGECDDFATFVAKQVGESLLTMLVLQTAHIVANYSQARISNAKNYVDYTAAPLDHPEEMGNYLRTQFITETAGRWTDLESSPISDDLRSLNQTLWDPEKSPAAVEAFTQSAKQDRDEGAILKLRKLCVSTHETAKKHLLGAYRACSVSFRGYLKGITPNYF